MVRNTWDYKKSINQSSTTSGTSLAETSLENSKEFNKYCRIKRQIDMSASLWQQNIDVLELTHSY